MENIVKENIVNRLLTFIPINTQVEPIISYAVIALFIITVALLSNIIAKNILEVIMPVLKQKEIIRSDTYPNHTEPTSILI